MFVSWRQARGVERACASDALWALRRHLSRGLRLRLVLSRSPRLMRRMALPVASALVAALVIGAILWGPRWLMPKPEIEWVDVPAGEFMMGSDPAVDPNADEDEMDQHSDQHSVYLDAYRISKYEITNGQYERCVRAGVCRVPGNRTYYDDPDYADHPVVYVDWYDARDFCTWVGKGLPTEAEWEYAARGPEGHIYPWGNDPPTCERAQFAECGGDTVPVGSLPDGASWCGAEDGNVWEWVADWYGGYPSEAQANPTGPETGSYKVLRGGSFNHNEANVRAAYRLVTYPVSGFGVLVLRQDSEFLGFWFLGF